MCKKFKAPLKSFFLTYKISSSSRFMNWIRPELSFNYCWLPAKPRSLEGFCEFCEFFRFCEGPRKSLIRPQLPARAGRACTLGNKIISISLWASSPQITSWGKVILVHGLATQGEHSFLGLRLSLGLGTRSRGLYHICVEMACSQNTNKKQE